MNDPDQSSPDQCSPAPASHDPDSPRQASIDQRLRQLTESLARQLDPEEVAEALARLQPAEASRRAMIVGLGLLLAERSVKATGEYLRQAPLLIDRLADAEWGPWVGVGMKIAVRSAVTAVRYFRESPSVFADIMSVGLRRVMFECADRCAERDAGLALELIRQAPAVIRVLPPELPSEPSHDTDAVRAELLQRWAECGERLAEQDTILASEYFKQSALLLLHLPVSALQVWAELGGTLVQPNQLGKPDYLPALEYFRVSPEWVGAVTPPELRPQLLHLVRAMTDEPPDRRVQLLKQVPQWLQAVSSLPHRSWLLEQAGLLAGQSPAAAIALLSKSGALVRRFLLRAPQAGLMTADLAGEQEWRRRMEEWVDHGRTLLNRSPETGLAYFRLESSAAEQSLDRVAGGLSLRQVARTLTLFAEGLSGYAVTIHPLQSGPTGEAMAQSLPVQLPYREGRTLFLPPFVSEFGSPDENFRYYRVMTAYQAAQLEFGAFEIDREAVIELARSFFDADCSVGSMEAPPDPDASLGLPGTVEELFNRFNLPALADDLWKIAEGGRIDACLRRAYPGLRRDLDLAVGYTLFLRPSIGSTDAQTVATGRSGPSTAERVVELLLQLSMAGRTKEPIPQGLEPLLYELGGLLQQVQRDGATAADALRIACDCCLRLIRRCTGEMEQAATPESASAEPSGNPLGQAGTPIVQGEPGDYRPVAEPQYRGRQGGQRGPSAAVPLSKGQPPPALTTPSLPDRSSKYQPARHQPGPAPSGEVATVAAGGGDPDPLRAEASGSVDGLTPDDGTRAGAETGRFAYPEWDASIQDYRPDWCTVHEQVMGSSLESGEPGRSAAAFADQILADYRGQLSLLRKMFERLRPDRFKKLKRREAGEEIDLDAAIEAVIDRRVGRTPSDKLYVQRDRRERDVAVALLVDVSGSTGRVLLDRPGLPGESPGRSIIQIEKESVLLLTEAVSAVGDALAVYAYSGDGRDRVEFYLVKDFDEPYDRRIGERIGAMTALVQNRDGTAIRHATRKLLERDAKTRLLLWLSDGRPFDRDYEGTHALADTRQALVEARRARVQTFCITVDRRGEDYQAALFAPSHYAVIDDVRQLPVRLPRLYQRVTT
jgi:nitric oxide reductase NorD protein